MDDPVKENPQWPTLDLDTLQNGIRPGISPAFGSVCAEAAAVCLAIQGHGPEVAMEIRGSFATVYHVHWMSPHEDAARSWSDHPVAVEFGAYGVAFLLIRELTEFTVIERARKGHGFDYWLGHDDELFQRKARLEVSGMSSGSDQDIHARTKEKLNQTKPSDESGLAAYIVVVEFRHPISMVTLK